MASLKVWCCGLGRFPREARWIRIAVIQKRFRVMLCYKRGKVSGLIRMFLGITKETNDAKSERGLFILIFIIKYQI